MDHEPSSPPFCQDGRKSFLSVDDKDFYSSSLWKYTKAYYYLEYMEKKSSTKASKYRNIHFFSGASKERMISFIFSGRFTHWFLCLWHKKWKYGLKSLQYLICETPCEMNLVIPAIVRSKKKWMNISTLSMFLCNVRLRIRIRNTQYILEHLMKIVAVIISIEKQADCFP